MEPSSSTMRLPGLGRHIACERKSCTGTWLVHSKLCRQFGTSWNVWRPTARPSDAYESIVRLVKNDESFCVRFQMQRTCSADFFKHEPNTGNERETTTFTWCGMFI